ncbi:hypothetical protein D8674_032561 [Pyrus ussuriensis x Pyrus communis]|uniref:Uncharacterized protein n=1 Tax=Pyrus ussuriensis x Pyrus communis TaxID=2448454 RepID=A0A5N5HIE3_9ROSA|nr:hypothetical protein D8674_032561 [Pyrus ussuriensis x Pyrus communis]
MVKFLLQICAELKNLTYLQPQDGCDDPDYSYLFKCKLCERVGMILMHPGLGKPLTQAASDARQFAPMMIFYFRGFVPVDFVFVGGWRAESVSFSSSDATFNRIKVPSVGPVPPMNFSTYPSGINFEHIDLSAGKFVGYDVEYPVMISNLEAAFVVGSFMPPEIRRGF